MRDAVEAAERLRTKQKTPHEMFSVIGAVLEQSPDISLNQIAWRFDTHGVGEETDQNRANTAPANAVPAPRQSGIVTAEVMNYDGNYRMAVARIQDFVRRLAQNDRVTGVTVLELPVDISSETDLSGNTNVAATNRGATFKIAILLGPES